MRHLRITRTFLISAATAALVGATGSAFAQQDDELEDRGAYYEDDAWYDVSEWLDGNDYNPTDEQIGIWDDESYDGAEPPEKDYGFNDQTQDDDWFYDYYDAAERSAYTDSDRSGDMYDHYELYRDYDRDGFYDSYSMWHDSDNDGTYDSYAVYWFNQPDTATQQQQMRDESTRRSAAGYARSHNVTGEITSKKTVKVRGAKHTVVRMQTDVGREVAVDLGPEQGLAKQNLTIEAGDRITVRGPMAKVGDKQLLAAQHVQAANQSMQIDRSGREISGTVDDTRTIMLRGHEHLVAVLDRDGQQVLVDLGPVQRVGSRPAKGQQLTCHGVPVRVSDDRVLFFASQYGQNQANMRQVDRYSEMQNRQSQQDDDGS